MNQYSSPVAIKFFSLALSLGLIGISCLPQQVKAQSQGHTGIRLAKVSVTFTPPGVGQPRDTAGGASRSQGQCPQDSQSLDPYVTPLMPASNHGLTVAAHPTFFVYIPQTSAKKVFFSLQDAEKNHHYQTILPLTGQPGIFSIKLPADAPALEVGKDYLWSAVLICEQGLRPDSPSVNGWIQRVEPNSTLVSQLQADDTLEQAASYGKAGIWYDTLATLASLKRSQPSDPDLANNWEELLKSVGLEKISLQPLLEQN